MPFLLKLRLTMLGTLTLLIGISTLFFAVLLDVMGAFSIITLAALVLAFNIFQWLVAPYFVDALYRTEEASERRYPRLHAMLRSICERSRIAAPKLMISNMGVPNAFAYGSPLTGNKVAVTRGLLENLEEEEVEAVIGHEVGHLKHRDVQLMVLVSLLPTLFYFIGRTLMFSGLYQRGRGGRNGAAYLLLIGIASMVIYFICNLIVLGLSRLREYYADRHSANVITDGRRKMAEALAKIVYYSSRSRITAPGFKALLISDPDHSAEDLVLLSRIGYGRDAELIRRLVSRRVTTAERILELFSTHPNIVKRVRAILTAG